MRKGGSSNKNTNGHRDLSTLNKGVDLDDNNNPIPGTEVYFDDNGNVYDKNGYPTGENVYGGWW